MSAILTIPDLALPEAEIMQEANGIVSDALRLAAAYGYWVACRDLEAVTTTSPHSEGATP